MIAIQRAAILDVVRQRADQDARKIGVQIVDVRLKRVDFPDKISQSIYDRMRSERLTVANQLRSEGAADAERIRAEADKEREVVLANAYKQAQEIKGAGDAKAGAIYAEAFGKSPEFYAFYRSMDAYKKSFDSKNDLLVLDPSSAFFKYLQDPKARGPVAPKQ